MATTFRADARAALVSILLAQKTATPTLLRAVSASRPGGFGEMPHAYVASLSETITWDAGTRTRQIIGAQVRVADTYREGTNDDLDDLIDALVDRFNTEVQEIPNAIIELVGVDDDTEDSIFNASTQTTTYYRAVALRFNLRKWEGRS